MLPSIYFSILKDLIIFIYSKIIADSKPVQKDIIEMLFEQFNNDNSKFLQFMVK